MTLANRCHVFWGRQPAQQILLHLQSKKGLNSLRLSKAELHDCSKGWLGRRRAKTVEKSYLGRWVLWAYEEPSGLLAGTHFMAQIFETTMPSSDKKKKVQGTFPPQMTTVHVDDIHVRWLLEQEQVFLFRILLCPRQSKFCIKMWWDSALFEFVYVLFA